MAYRMAIRRTQKQVDAERSAVIVVETADRRQLQKLAKAKGIPANQSTEALREALSND
jgi:phage gp16-like protein